MIDGKQYAEFASSDPTRWLALQDVTLHHSKDGVCVVEHVKPRNGNPVITVRFANKKDSVKFNNKPFIEGRISLSIPSQQLEEFSGWLSAKEKKEAERIRLAAAEAAAKAWRNEQVPIIKSIRTRPPSTRTQSTSIDLNPSECRKAQGLKKTTSMQQGRLRPLQELNQGEKLALEVTNTPSPNRSEPLYYWLCEKSDLAGNQHEIWALGQYRKNDYCHHVSEAIRQSKCDAEYPPIWPTIVASVITQLIISTQRSTLTTIVPSKRGHSQRFEKFLSLVEREAVTLLRQHKTIPKVLFRQGVFGFSKDALSNRSLNREQRYANVKEHMYLSNGAVLKDRDVIVIDDVVTTGATLLTAKNLLETSGLSGKITLIALAATV